MAAASPPPDSTPRLVVHLATDGTPAVRARQPAAQRRVPSVAGMTLREAVRSLHYAGFRVQLLRGEAASTSSTQPAAGTSATVGSTVRLRHSR